MSSHLQFDIRVSPSITSYNMKSFTMRSAVALSALLVAVGLPAANAAEEVSKGCYSDATPLEDQGSYTYQSDGYCQKLCLKDNYSVFALTGGTHCLCGNKLPSDSAKTSDSDCDKDCAGWPDVKCMSPITLALNPDRGGC